MKINKIRIGTRGSKLALAQAEQVKSLIIKEGFSKESVEIIKIVTTGDRILDQPLYEIGGKALFTKELEEALLQDRIDMAVHSLKDIPAIINENLVIASVLEREDPRDAFISYQYSKLSELPKGGVIATSSVRRKSLVLSYRGDLQTVPLRGNVTTRMDKLKEGKFLATILAMAGLNRLGIKEKCIYPIDTKEFLPAVAQGAIGIECSKSRTEILEILNKINHKQTEICVNSERAFLEVLEGTCQTPLAAFASLENDVIKLECLVASLDGSVIYKTTRTGSIKEAIEIGLDAGKELKFKGKNIL